MCYSTLRGILKLCICGLGEKNLVFFGTLSQIGRKTLRETTFQRTYCVQILRLSFFVGVDHIYCTPFLRVEPSFRGRIRATNSGKPASSAWFHLQSTGNMFSALRKCFDSLWPGIAQVIPTVIAFHVLGHFARSGSENIL